MRIVAGRWRGREIVAPRDERVRPTGDRVREAWMSIVHSLLPHARVLDLYAGSGALGLEALSRGAVSADFVEIAPPSIRALQSNAARLGAGDAAVVHRADALRFVSGLPALAYDIAFADPPYAHDAAERLAEAWLETPFASLLGIEHEASRPLSGASEMRKYGRTAISFFRYTLPDAPSSRDDDDSTDGTP
jgi:16S rRNA (guanine966-N2)-methyltransferase